MDTQKLHSERLARVRNAMDGAKLDGLVLFKPQNTFYVSSFNAIIYSRPIIAVVPREGDATLIVPRLRTDHAKEESRINDIRVYHKIRLTDSPTGIAADPLELLRDVLSEKRLLTSRLGLDYDYITVAASAAVGRTLGGAELVDATPVLQELRIVKDEEELLNIKRAADLTDVGLIAALDTLRPGVSEVEVSVAAMNAMNDHWRDRYPDCEVAGFGDLENWTVAGLWCYVIGRAGLYGCENPGSYRLKRGDHPFVVVMSIVNGYHCENERTVSIGKATPDEERVYAANAEATRAMWAAIKPGVSCSAVAGRAASVFESYGYARFASARAGHSMGLSGHEQPSFARGEETLLRENMVMSVEPGLCVDPLNHLHVNNSNVGVVTSRGFELLTQYRNAERIVISG